MNTEEFEYEIRLATQDDVKPLVDLAMKFWNESDHSTQEDVDPDRYENALRSRMVDADGWRVIVAVHNDQIVGYHIIYVLDDYKKDGQYDGEMFQFFVHPDYRASGISRDLVEMAVQIWDDWGCTKVYACASPEIGNIELSQFRNLFAKFGFKETGIIMTRKKGGE